MAIHASGFTLSTSEFVWLLGALCRTFGIPWDAALALQRFPPKHTVHTLYEAGKLYGLRFDEMDPRAFEWGRPLLPLVAFRQEGDNWRPAMVVRVEAGRALYLETGVVMPLTAPVADFVSRIEPAVLLVTHDLPESDPDRRSPGGWDEFGFRPTGGGRTGSKPWAGPV